ncbi:hypothetical protein H5410_030241 [Solanum commersonii]|uniref:Uncharacterized protein n=1 Tax=Solanum commersonii TaxID=4109 RepID=A0A9J5YGA1_SOLCO|nr:hypothetical protein H5410_030241 [Solanum commersonii]
MSPNYGLINTPNLNFCLSSSKTQVRQFKKDVLNSATQDLIMNTHKTQFTHAKIKCALKVSSCDTPLSKNLKLTVHASNGFHFSQNHGLKETFLALLDLPSLFTTPPT